MSTDETPSVTHETPEPPHDASDGLRIVVIGGSAGSLKPMQTLLERLNPNVDAALVIASHRAPEQASALPQVLASHCRLPVAEAGNGMPLQRGRVHVIPPGKAPSLGENLTLLLRDLDDQNRYSPIDELFRSLAVLGERTIAVVLSGNGSDGCLGVKEIKAAGGFVLVQDPSTADYASMPQAAIAAAPPDQVLRPDELAANIQRLLALVLDGEPIKSAPPPQPDPQPDQFIDRVLGTLRDSSGHDFTHYKRSTVRRRIQRRMQVLEVENQATYLDLLEKRPSEVELLFSELLIGVTSFFRDKDAFAAVEKAVAEYIEQLPVNRELRVWVPACSTGEEAYSLAIVIHEQLARANKRPAVQIFGTDLDPRSVQTARTGRYPIAAAADIGNERMERYFVAEDGTLRVSKEIREMLVFAPQNLTKDPPFTRIDLLSCRNMLIYLEPELQQKVLALFHYSVLPQGLLFLGSSESLGALDDAFSVLDKKWKIFSNRESPRAQRLTDLRLDIPSGVKFTTDGHGSEQARQPSPRRGFGVVADRILLDSLVPPSVLITGRGEIVYIHGRTGRFLEPAGGEPNANVFDMAREGLRLELPAAVREALREQRTVHRHHLQVRTNGGFESVSLGVKPLLEPEQTVGLLLITFETRGDKAHSPQTGEAALENGASSPRAAQLEEELQHVRESLQGTIEELETSNEELKSTNEELQSTNEELQSTNEELETSREEMQSLNEELQTLNAELQDRNEDLSQINDDMQNLLNSTDIATVFLDSTLNIKRFTPPAKKLFHLRDSDVGRPLSDMAANLRYEGLIEDARQVLNTLVFTEKEVQTSEGDWRQMRVLPYRTAQNVIDGLVITFVGIDQLKAAEQHARRARAFGEAVLAGLPTGIVIIDEQAVVRIANDAACRMFGVSQRRISGERMQTLASEWSQPQLERQVSSFVLGEAFAPLRVQGPLGTRESKDLLLTGLDLADAASDGRYLLMVQDLATKA